MESTRPSTPELHEDRSFHHFDTPVKARIIEADRLRANGQIKLSRNQIFLRNGVSRTTGYRILRGWNEDHTIRRLHNDPTREETRGRPAKITDEQINEGIRIINALAAAHGKPISWAALGKEIGTGATPQTVKSTFEKKGYVKLCNPHSHDHPFIRQAKKGGRKRGIKATVKA